ncbi:MAG TPA: DUF1684 domain-containing protein [Ktedonobacterales bacterium]|nr:DUF1684 domain-containing protein [Ktedonobacterales bacterium]
MTHQHQHSDHAYIQRITEQRAEKDAFFGSAAQSPIPARERAGFAGLRYYPPDPAYRVAAELTVLPHPETILLGSTQGDVRPQVRYAELRFTLEGEACTLVGFTDPDAKGSEHVELFVPFRDATSGSETYGAGRYLETPVRVKGDGSRSAMLDFNLAYSPWCAYNPAYSCTLPPPENRLNVSVRAGERSYHEDDH